MKLIEARAVLFDDALAIEEVRPATFFITEITDSTSRTASSRGESMLRTLALIEESRHEDKDDQLHDHSFRRLEAKVDVLTSLISGLLRSRGECDPERRLIWSARGALLETPSSFNVGTLGMFRVQPSDRTPETTMVPARVIATEPKGNDNLVALQFEGLSPGFVEEIDRHLFRVHRRLVAESRRSTA